MIDFSFVFPTANAFWTSLIILAASILFSALFNHQYVHAKIINTERSLLDFALFWIWLAIVESANFSPERIPYVTAVAVVFFGYKIVGDWIGFLMRSMHFHPGGVQGWIWAQLRRISLRMAESAERHYQVSVSPEKSLYERHSAQFNRFETEAKAKPVRNKRPAPSAE